MTYKIYTSVNGHDDAIEICEGCSGACQRIGEDGISYCEECGIVEGYTKWVSEQEYETLNG